jgi:hypothetical protein
MDLVAVRLMKTAEGFERIGVHGATPRLAVLSAPAPSAGPTAALAATDAATACVCSSDERCGTTL